MGLFNSLLLASASVIALLCLVCLTGCHLWHRFAFDEHSNLEKKRETIKAVKQMFWDTNQNPAHISWDMTHKGTWTHICIFLFHISLSHPQVEAFNVDSGVTQPQLSFTAAAVTIQTWRKCNEKKKKLASFYMRTRLPTVVFLNNTLLS